MNDTWLTKMYGTLQSLIGQSHDAYLGDSFPIWWGGVAALPPHHPTKDTFARAFGLRTPTS
jgi:hypothetical protein